MSLLRVAVVGVGHLGRHHARVLAGIEGVRLVAVADSRREQAEAVAGPLDARAVTDYRLLLDEVDAVSIAAPTFLHREIGTAFLERGIHCMIEKPLAANHADAEHLVSVAKAAGATLQVGHIERFNTALQTLVSAGITPKYVTAERLGTYTFRSTDIGVVHDLMIHDLDVLLHLVPSPVRSVLAVGVSIFGSHEDVANARIEFADGCIANLTASRASFQAVRKMRVWGAEGYATVDFATRNTTVVRPSEQLRRGEVDLAGVDMTQPAAVKTHLFGNVLQVEQVQAEGREPLALELEDFIAAIRSGSAPRVTGEHGSRACAVADLILQSLNAHAWEGTEIGLTGPRLEPAASRGIPAPKLWRHPNSRVGEAGAASRTGSGDGQSSS
jgi:predicted dehydrogenase